ncbi:hypothetical protein [Pontibacter sp. G13]|uniref:hypothetical protein n=1 Tax=Pontibacter sp. G13 TaxID=3074898 RepID=UPI00288AB527|nr:hypothetical protein [Pontibacter sp. G13]WNJ17826.1 hypothetical protein RJD25_23485 [Pontibacter sp. G13]
MSNAKSPIRLIIWVLVLPLILYAMYRGLNLKKVEIPGLFVAEFEPTDREDAIRYSQESITEEERTAGQAVLRDLIKESLYESSPVEQAQRGNYGHFVGSWLGVGGTTYSIQRHEGTLVIQEYHPLYGLTAAGNGHLEGNRFLFNYQTSVFSHGTGELTASPDGQSLQGFFRDAVTGHPTKAWLQR